MIGRKQSTHHSLGVEPSGKLDQSQGMTYARNKALGAYGEKIAAEFLQKSGMAILDRNWTSRFGEIDLVARDGDTLVVCEVKTRTSNRYGTSSEAVTEAKATRLRTLAEAWLQAHEIGAPRTRIDVVAVHIPARGAADVRHIKAVA